MLSIYDDFSGYFKSYISLTRCKPIGDKKLFGGLMWNKTYGNRVLAETKIIIAYIKTLTAGREYIVNGFKPDSFHPLCRYKTIYNVYKKAGLTPDEYKDRNTGNMVVGFRNEHTAFQFAFLSKNGFVKDFKSFFLYNSIFNQLCAVIIDMLENEKRNGIS